MPWFGYQKNPFGVWAPCTWASRPSPKGTEGRRITFLLAAELSPEETGLSLSELSERYPVKQPSAQGAPSDDTEGA